MSNLKEIMHPIKLFATATHWLQICDKRILFYTIRKFIATSCNASFQNNLLFIN